MEELDRFITIDSDGSFKRRNTMHYVICAFQKGKCTLDCAMCVECKQDSQHFLRLTCGGHTRIFDIKEH
jgi:hypothetical protein